MRWRLRRHRPATETLPHDEERLEAAREARETSEQALQKVRRRWPEVTKVSSSLRRHRMENHFREMFERALKDSHDPASG